MAELDFRRLGFTRDPEAGRRTVWAMVVVLAYSRRSFVWPTFSFLWPLEESLTMQAVRVAITGDCQLPDAVIRIGQLEVDDHAQTVLAIVSNVYQRNAAVAVFHENPLVVSGVEKDPGGQRAIIAGA